MKNFLEIFFDNNYERLQPVIEDSSYIPYINIATAYDRVCNESFHIIDCKYHDIIYMSQNLKDFIGFSVNPASQSLNDCFINSVSPQDVATFRNLTEIFPSIYNELPKSERRSLAIIGNSHLINRYEKVLVFGRSIPLAEDSEGKLRLILSSITGSTSTRAGEVKITKGYGSKKEYYSLIDNQWHREKEKSLTAREHMILNFIAQGLRSTDIAEKICISDETVKKYRKSIIRKLDAENITHAIKIAYNLGLM